MLLPLVALSGVAAFAFDTAVTRFANAAGEAEREAIPLARLSSSIRFLEPPAYGAYLGDDPRGVGAYEDAATRTRRGFAEVRGQLGGATVRRRTCWPAPSGRSSPPTASSGASCACPSRLGPSSGSEA